MNHSARYCDCCDINWPMNEEYRGCPLCANATELETGTAPLSQAQAKAVIITRAAALKKYRDFDVWYEERELERFRAELAAYEEAS